MPHLTPGPVRAGATPQGFSPGYSSPLKLILIRIYILINLSGGLIPLRNRASAVGLNHKYLKKSLTPLSRIRRYLLSVLLTQITIYQTMPQVD